MINILRDSIPDAIASKKLSESNIVCNVNGDVYNVQSFTAKRIPDQTIKGREKKFGINNEKLKNLVYEHLSSIRDSELKAIVEKNIEFAYEQGWFSNELTKIKIRPSIQKAFDSIIE